MKVSIAAVTQPLVTDEKGHTLTAEQFIVYCARVSNPSNQLNLDTAPKLLAYCIKHRHWSIFEQASMTVEIVTSRAVSAQLCRHRSFVFQEFSQRYAAVTAFEPVELRKQGATNRQGSEEVFDPQVFDEELKIWVNASVKLRQHLEVTEHLYQSFLGANIARECARMVLPMCSQTRLYMTGNVRSWIHFLLVRNDPHTQKEHRLVAEATLDIFRTTFPDTYSAVWPG